MEATSKSFRRSKNNLWREIEYIKTDRFFNIYALEWLEQFGLTRENDDLEPMTNWSEKEQENIKFGKIILAGRFGQWKYFWTDDCVLRGKTIGKSLLNSDLARI